MKNPYAYRHLCRLRIGETLSNIAAISVPDAYRMIATIDNLLSYGENNFSAEDVIRELGDVLSDHAVGFEEEAIPDNTIPDEPPVEEQIRQVQEELKQWNVGKETKEGVEKMMREGLEA